MRRVADSRSSSLVIELFTTRHQRISVIPWIQNAVSQFIFSPRFMCFAYCHIATYHLAHVKTECKGAATPSPFSLQTAPSPPCIIHLHYKWVGTVIPLYPALLSILLYVCKEVVVFWQQCQWDQNCEGFLLIQRG